MELRFVVLTERRTDDGGRVYSVKKVVYVDGNKVVERYLRYEVDDQAITYSELDGPDPTGRVTLQRPELKLPVKKGVRWRDFVEKEDWMVDAVGLTLRTPVGERSACVRVVGSREAPVCSFRETPEERQRCINAHGPTAPERDFTRRFAEYCSSTGLVRTGVLMIEKGKVVEEITTMELSSIGTQ
jgi:hypothetical protein